jgi:hypothetical protein
MKLTITKTLFGGGKTLNEGEFGKWIF